jgi:hypothetical protein
MEPTIIPATSMPAMIIAGAPCTVKPATPRLSFTGVVLASLELQSTSPDKRIEGIYTKPFKTQQNKP